MKYRDLFGERKPVIAMLHLKSDHRLSALDLARTEIMTYLQAGVDAVMVDKLQALRAGTGVVVLGGVRFKYQEVRSGRTLAEDLRLGMERCDAIVVTGAGTGMATPRENVTEFRRIIGDFPLVIGAGVTIDTVAESLRDSDGMIVGSYFKQNHHDVGDVEPAFVQAFMDKKRSVEA